MREYGVKMKTEIILVKVVGPISVDQARVDKILGDIEKENDEELRVMTQDSSQLGLLNVKTDFERFFHDVVEFQKSRFRKMGKDFPYQVLLVVKDGKVGVVSIYTTYSGAIIDDEFTEFPADIYGRPVRPDLVVKCLLAGCNPQAYVATYQGWIRKGNTGRDRLIGSIVDLPAEERLEILTFIGRSLDGSQAYSKYFEVKREIHDDDSSKLLDLAVMEGWRAS